MERLGLGGCGRTPYRRLSGGQQQRLALAMALVGRPELVFLDEPTAGLDPQARRATWELVEELRRDGVTVVLTTHSWTRPSGSPTRSYVVDRGRVVAAGTPAELTARGADEPLRFRRPTRASTSGSLLAARCRPGATVRRAAPGSYLVTRRRSTRSCSPPSPPGAPSNGVLAEELAVERRTLEDVFLELTGRELRA